MPVTGVLWLLLCLQRGLLQSARAYREVGLSVVLEALGRLAVGARARRRRRSASPAPTSARSPRSRSTAVALAWLLRRRLGPPDARRAPAPAARARARRGAADRRADARRRAPERRRDHGQARARRQRRRRLRGHHGRRQGRGLDRRRPRLLGAAGGDPPRRRGRATRAPCSPAALGGDRRASPRARWRSSRSCRSCCCGPRSAPSTSRAPTCC